MSEQQRFIMGGMPDADHHAIDGESVRVPDSIQTPVGKVTVYQTKIVAFNPTALLLGKLEHEYKGRIYDVTVKEGDAAAREARRKLVAARVALETARKQEKADVLERGKLIDSEAKWIEKSLRDLEDPIDQQIKAEEKRKADEKAERDRLEKIRVDAIRAKIDDMKQLAFANVGQPSALVQLAIDVANDVKVTKEEYEEFAVEADTVRSETLIALHRMFGAAEALEKQQADVKAQQEVVARQALANKDQEKALQQREQALNVQGKEPASTPPPPSPSIAKPALPSVKTVARKPTQAMMDCAVLMHKEMLSLGRTPDYDHVWMAMFDGA